VTVPAGGDEPIVNPADAGLVSELANRVAFTAARSEALSAPRQGRSGHDLARVVCDETETGEERRPLES
jgi:hypothetical protein